MNIDKIKRLAVENADRNGRRGTSVWSGLYYGYIDGMTDCKLKKIQIEDGELQCNHPWHALQGDGDMSTVICTLCGEKLTL